MLKGQNSHITHRDSSEIFLLDRLYQGGTIAETAWRDFLDRYSKLILKVIWQFEHDRDEVMEKYLHVCEKLIQNDFDILRKFTPNERDNPPKFTTWLSIVVKNLCIEKHRKETGRKRLPRAILRMSEIDQTVFKLYYWKGYSTEEIEQYLINKHGDSSTGDTAVESLERIQSIITSKGVSGRNDKMTRISYDDEYSYPDTMLTNENNEEYMSGIDAFLDIFTSREKLVFRLRIWEDMSVPDIAKIVNISSDRKIYSILQKIMSELRKRILEEKRL